jgi:hypothetical protein
MRFLLIIEFIFVTFIFIGCVTSGATRFRNYDEYRKYSDSTSAQYQKDSFHPKRTVAYLKPFLDILASGISSVLNNPRVKSKVLAKSITFYVLPSGQINKGGFFDFPNPDSQKFKDTTSYFAYYRPDSILDALVDSVARNYRTDSIPNYKPYLLLTGSIKDEPSGFVFAFKDSSRYLSSITGGRSRASIMRVVMNEISNLRYAYNRKLLTNPGLKGKIIIKFVIDEFGNVIFSAVMPAGTTLNNVDLQNEFASIIKSWKFSKINKPGDITEVEYPFMCSQ